MFEMSSGVDEEVVSPSRRFEVCVRGEPISSTNALHGFALMKIKAVPSITETERFALGPAEWLWSSLTYWKRRPIHVPSEVMIDTEAILTSWKRSNLLR